MRLWSDVSDAQMNLSNASQSPRVYSPRQEAPSGHDLRSKDIFAK
jgi:hypothetical protein